MFVKYFIKQFLFTYNSSNHRYDWLEIRDGDSENAPLIGSRLCGSSTPQPIVSSGNHLFIQFHSDSDLVSSGFEIKVDVGK